MRVLHVIPSIGPLRGGPSAAALAMVAALRQQGVDAELLTTDDNGPGRLADLPLGRWSQWQGVPVLAFPRWMPPVGPLREFAYSPGLQRWLGAHLHDYDLLHVHALFSFPSTIAMALARRERIPYLLRSIGQLDRWSLAQSARRKRWMLRLIERRNLEGAAAIHVTSEQESQEVEALGLGVPRLVIPLGVTMPQGLPPPQQRAPGDPVRFLFLSRLHAKKRLEILLEALALVADRNPGAAWELRIAGSGDPDYAHRCQERARELGVADRCRWLGFLEGEAKWGELRSADWFVLPSASENFGIAVVEALAAGTPVLISPEVAVARDVAAAGAGRVCPAVPGSMADALEEALQPPTLQQRDAARNLAHNQFSWSSLACRLDQAYLSIVPPSTVTPR
jgi:glycosyltransferase involved in cell wall biosynthesis